MTLLVELLLTLTIVPLAYAAPHLGTGWFAAIESRLAHFSARRRLAVLAIFLLALATRLAVLPIEPIPAPGVHDEFGYLLSADTFAHGRLTNSTHPMWMHFESMTIIQQPTYCSAFYPAQGFFLAVGQVLFHHPFWGVCLSAALMCAALCWALQGWMPPAWAFLGGILPILRLATFTYWANSYWGGAVAAFGGALVLGALPRIKRRQRSLDAIILGLGLAILANSRPYEGLFFSIPVLVALAVFVFKKKRPQLTTALHRIVMPLGIVMVLNFTFMGYYFWRTTGNPLRPPYLVDVKTYMPEPQFIWGTLGNPPNYNHPVMERFYRGYHVHKYLDARHDLLGNVMAKVFQSWAFFVGPAPTLPFFILAAILPYGMKLRDFGPKTGFLLILLPISFLALLLVPFYNHHYAAPMLCAIYAILLQAMRRVRLWDRRGQRRGRFVVRAIVFNCAVIFLITAALLAHEFPHQKILPFDLVRTNPIRSQILKKLRQKGGRYLIFVHYQSQHDVENEWVFNNADIDDSTVIWAREMSPAQNRELIHYFKNREILLLEADTRPPKIGPYPLANLQSGVRVATKDVSLHNPKLMPTWR
jgi:hypothetical protein